MFLPLDVSSRAVLLLSQVAIYSYIAFLSLITSLRAVSLFCFFFCCCCCLFFWLIATLRIFFIRAIKVQIYFCRMIENHFVMVLIVFKLSSVARCEVSSCFGFWIQIILATLPIVLQLSQAYTCRSIESNFATGFKLVLPREIVFFGGLRFPSSMRLEVSGSLQIETVFHVNLQYWTIQYFRCTDVIKMEANKFFLADNADFFRFRFSGDKLWYFFHLALLFKTGFCPQFRHFCWQHLTTEVLIMLLKRPMLGEQALYFTELRKNHDLIHDNIS